MDILLIKSRYKTRTCYQFGV